MKKALLKRFFQNEEEGIILEKDKDIVTIEGETRETPHEKFPRLTMELIDSGVGKAQVDKENTLKWSSWPLNVELDQQGDEFKLNLNFSKTDKDPWSNCTNISQWSWC